MDTVQVFVKNQRQWKAPPLDPDDVEQWKSLCGKPDFGPTVAHATYLINLASGDKVLHARSRDAFAGELRRCDELGIPYLVVHPGSPKDDGAEAGIARVAQALDHIFAKHPDLTTMPLLETTAGQGKSLGRTFAELRAIIEQVKEPERMGVCIDTCHVFAAGYDIRTPAGYAALTDEADQTVGLQRVRCWHFNDSVGPCGSHLDRHAHIGEGELGSQAFGHVLADERFDDVPMILETPKGEDERGRNFDRLNLQRLRRIATRVRG